MSDIQVVFITVPNTATAARIATAVVRERLAACANIVPGVRSIYLWEGKVRDDRELLLVMKTTRRRYEALERRVKALHPYEIPEVIALPVGRGSGAYLKWVRESVRRHGKEPQKHETRNKHEARNPKQARNAKL
jgi:periplasmic divalent cation tolerance protein